MTIIMIRIIDDDLLLHTNTPEERTPALKVRMTNTVKCLFIVMPSKKSSLLIQSQKPSSTSSSQPPARRRRRHFRYDSYCWPAATISIFSMAATLLLLCPKHSESLTQSQQPPTTTTTSTKMKRQRQRQQQFIGFDLGTTGARISIIEECSQPSSITMNGGPSFQEVYSHAIAWTDCGDNDNGVGGGGGGTYDDAHTWMAAIERLAQCARDAIPDGLTSVASICVSGTSASCLMVDRETLAVTRKPRMYDYDIESSSSSSNNNNDNDAVVPKHSPQQRAIELLDRHCPPLHTARARTGSLAKLVSWVCESPLHESEVFLHQSDYVSLWLMNGTDDDDGNNINKSMRKSSTSGPVQSDWHNCLKLGYDVRNDCWPDWIEGCLVDAGISNPLERNGGVIPLRVHSPDTPMGTISKCMARRLGLPEDTILVGGTTDSNAAFFAAAGVTPQLGTAVTSLGSTMAIKLLSSQYVEDADRGVYSHRFPNFLPHDGDDNAGNNTDAWLVGGASNVGCAIFRALNFTNAELEDLSIQLDPMVDSPYADYYYPLCKVGERFPIADPNKVPILEPVPDSRREYLHGLLQSISNVERNGFKVLNDLGAPLPTTVWTCGGGSKNDAWSQMRQRILRQSFGHNREEDIAVRKATNTEASFGAALLAAARCRL